MFKYLNKQGVLSDSGYIVQRTGRFTSEYQEDTKKITISHNPGILPDGRFCEIISKDAFSKWDDGTAIPKEKQDEILKNFTEAMEFQGMGVVVD